MSKGKFYAGTSGLIFKEPNKKSFPEFYRDKSRLSYYGSLFNSLEVNSSFYKIPRFPTFARWAESVPEDFKFTVKLWKGITHEPTYKKEELVLFFKALEGLGNKRGCLLIQFPAKTAFTTESVQNLLKNIKQSDPDNHWRIALEIRNNNWYGDDFFRLLDEFGISIVIHDKHPEKLIVIPIKSPFIYLRFHGPAGDYKGSYSNEYLKKQSDFIMVKLQENLDVYAYFNNTIGDAYKNIRFLLDEVKFLSSYQNSL